METACRIYWASELLHYVLFPLSGPLLALLFAYISPSRSPATALWTLVGFFGLLLASGWLSLRASFICQMRLFGNIGDDPGDVGIVFISLPIFVLMSVACSIVTAVIIYRRFPRGAGSAA